MKIKLYSTPGEFLEENREFLLEYEAAAQLNLGNAQAHWEEACRPDLLFGRCEEDGRGVLLFGNTLPWNICLNAIPGDPAALAAAVLLAEYLLAGKTPVNGVTASKALCGAFCSAYGGAFTLRSAMNILVLKELTEPLAAPGKVRKATMNDLELLAEWDQAFHREAVHEEHSLEEMWEHAKAYIQKNGYLWENPDGQPVSVAYEANRRLTHGVSITGVFTPPEHRGKGYCQNTVAAACREALKKGYDYCTLFVNQRNPVSNRAYQKIGFQILEDAYGYRLTSED